MRSQYFCLLIVCILVNLTSGKLIFVHVHARHGARAPLTLVRDSYFNGLNISELTEAGKSQMFKIGERLREKYTNNDYFPLLSNESFARTTSSQRSIDSAQYLMQGIFPGDSKYIGTYEPDFVGEYLKKLGSVVYKRGIYSPYFMIEDPIAYGKWPAAFNSFSERTRNDTLWNSFNERFQNTLYVKLEELYNIPHDLITLDYAFFLWDALISEKFHKITEKADKMSLEDWALCKETSALKFDYVHDEVFNKILPNLFLSPVIEMMKKTISPLTDIEYDRDQTSVYKNSKFILYTTHDVFLYYLNNLIKPRNLELKHVDFGAYFTFELHQNDSSECSDNPDLSCFYVTISYNDFQVHSNLCKLKECKLDELQNMLYKYDSKIWEQELTKRPGSMSIHKKDLEELYDMYNRNHANVKDDL